MKVVALMACHNRKHMTVSCIRAFLASADHAAISASVVLYDDGSEDGTADEVSQEFGPQVQIIEGSGDAFWARGMAHAESSLLRANGSDVENERIDYIFWLNDDTILYPEALSILIDVQRNFRAESSLVVGNIVDPVSGATTYGGYIKTGIHPLRYKRKIPGRNAGFSTIDNFNGNCVLIPFATSERIGGIDGSYSHAFADFDYGLRARRLGIAALLAETAVGTCSRNEESKGTILEDWRRFTSVKGGGHLKSLVRIVKLAKPRTWPLYVAVTYSAWWVRRIASPPSGLRFARFRRSV